MPEPSTPDRDLALELAPRRALRLLMPQAGTEGAAAEAGGTRCGPPDDLDRRLIARRIRSALPTRWPVGGRDSAAEADALAATLVSRAQAAVAALQAGAPTGAIGEDDAQALEAIICARGRPALRVDGDRLEPIDSVRHPGSEMWTALVEDHEAMLAGIAASTGAVRVTDRHSGNPPWVQGTAWYVGYDRVITNRHVLFPRRAPALCERRKEDPNRARFRTNLQVIVDFAFDDGPPRSRLYTMTEVLYVSEDRDPIDVAVVRIAPASNGAMPNPLALATGAVTGRSLYIVGHPCPVENASQDVQAVFGSLDGRKRISLGERMSGETGAEKVLLHDASTIGGYSGGCVVGFLMRDIAGLHYYGNSIHGNMAVPSPVLREHGVFEFL
ncbi:serine protease [Azospirillum sp. TSO35-2]|uniref:trypsin-like serine peptidase n=1 Tax=Azospirillum sp. TSO35-2 TaxID=716796 RepID=UPI000D60C0B2|nr:serine protease [Azospirillum sp. TSO35-2]PWC32776.1 hypothetical protein TSO352_19385 [Azospirillum sp. TSO35-2]